jgi:TPR repeat protein
MRASSPLVLLVLACATKPASPQEGALRALQGRPGWLFVADRCPADVMPAGEVTWQGDDNLCETNLPGCLDRCQQRDARACYEGALQVQRLGNEPASEALFLRACTLGIPSGCTNRAAGMTKNGNEGDAAVRCAVRTFQRTCEANDPWGCTMFGWHLMEGLGIERDRARAGRILKLACVRYGKEDPACQRALELLQQLAQEQRGQSI